MCNSNMYAQICIDFLPKMNTLTVMYTRSIKGKENLSVTKNGNTAHLIQYLMHLHFLVAYN